MANSIRNWNIKFWQLKQIAGFLAPLNAFN